MRHHQIKYSLLLAACGLLATTSANVFAQPYPIHWVGASGANYNDVNNWLFEGEFPLGILPGGDPMFPGDVAMIGNSTQQTGVALLNSAVPTLGSVVLGNVAGSSGTLNVTAGGDITTEPQGGTVGGFNVGGGGGSGQGTLNISGGSVAGSALNLNAISQINLSGTGSLSFSGAANLAGTMQITGGSASFSAGSLSLPASSTYSPVITSGAVAKANIAGAATLNGSLQVAFSGGPTPTPGTTWDLIEANNFLGSGFSSVNVTGLPTLPAGQQFLVNTVDAPSSRVVAQLQLVELLTLQVNPNTGALSILSGSATGTNIDGYQVLSSSGFLTPGSNWTTLAPAAGWQVANASPNQLAELKSTPGFRTVSQSSPLSLGTPYSLGSLPFGTPASQDLTFNYNTSDGQSYTGIVEFVGGEFYNNFVLTIDPTSGLAELKNDSAVSVPIDSYQIRSESGALASGAWNQFGGAWQAANTSSFQLAELNPSGFRTLAPGQSILLGNIFPNVGSIDPVTDLTLVAASSDPGAQVPVIEAAIRVGNVSGTPGGGDFNGDGIVDGHDFLAWQRNTALGSLSDWESNFGSGGALNSTVAAVPEPSAALLACCFLTALVVCRRR